MNSTAIYYLLAESASRIQRHGGQVPLPDPTLRALFAAYVWRTEVLGITTGDQAVLTGVPRATVDYARVILENGDVALIDAVLAGDVSLRQAALSVHRGLKLVAAYGHASATNKVQFGRTVGPDKVFDEVVVPALGPPIDPVVTIPIATIETPAPKPNGKASNGNGSHLYRRRRPGAPPAIVNVSTTH